MIPLLLGLAWALPTCVVRPPEVSTRDALLTTKPADDEVLARLVYAEGRSTGFPDDPAVHRAIAWGVVNRVRLAERSATAARWYGTGVVGVVFKSGQFNPAVSTRSRFSGDFLCPKDEARWGVAQAAATEALARREGGPTPVAYARTEAELQTGLDLVVNFYYPSSEQARGPDAPWEGDLPRVSVTVDGVVLEGERVRFYRLGRMLGDVRPVGEASPTPPPG